MPTVSIITPCYNSAEFIEETIHCVLDQSFTDWEWLITDDCSTDETVSIIQQFDDDRIKLQTAKHNGGAGKARNIALEKASGRFITFLDADDIWENNFLAEMVGFMTKNNYELAYSNYARCNEKMIPQIKDFQADTIVTFDNLLKTCRLSLLSSMYDSQRIGKMFFPENTKREDHIMWLNLLQKIDKGYPLPKTMAKYRMRENSVSRKKSNIMKDQYLVYKDFMKFSTLKSLYYTAHWAFNGFLKYAKIFN
ncbi:MAG: glycosyl transferase family 2 [Flavobacteriales bacterium]|nr:MAG: glycosyl transferase family 2 [Flavobacteriales bacterium]